MSLKSQNQAGERLLRLPEVLTMIPVCKSSWWLGVKTGRYPQPVRLGKRTVAWRYSDILALIEGKAG